MKFQIILTVDERHLGPMLAQFPKGAVFEVNRLVEKANGEYKARGGSGGTADSILSVMKNPMAPAEVLDALKGKHKPRAITSAFYGLRNRGFIRKQSDGRYKRIK